jgi:hypothetical protein
VKSGVLSAASDGVRPVWGSGKGRRNLLKN